MNSQLSGRSLATVCCLIAITTLIVGCVERSLTPTEAAPTTDTDTSLTPGQGEQAPCAWVWARRHLPDLSDQVEAALEAAGISGAGARATAFGEECVDAKTNKVIRFAVMETDYLIELQVEDLRDLEALGLLTVQVLEVLARFPPGKISLQLVADEERYLRMSWGQAIQALEEGLSGVGLMKTLGYQP